MQTKEVWISQTTPRLQSHRKGTIYTQAAWTHQLAPRSTTLLLPTTRSSLRILCWTYLRTSRQLDQWWIWLRSLGSHSWAKSSRCCNRDIWVKTISMSFSVLSMLRCWSIFIHRILMNRKKEGSCWSSRRAKMRSIEVVLTRRRSLSRWSCVRLRKSFSSIFQEEGWEVFRCYLCPNAEISLMRVSQNYPNWSTYASLISWAAARSRMKVLDQSVKASSSFKN